MSVVYRALWQDSLGASPGEYLDEFARLLNRWATEGGDAAVPDEGSRVVTTQGGAERTISVRRVNSSQDEETVWSGLEVMTRDVLLGASDGETVWTTVARTILREGTASTWVESRVESDALDRREKVGRPRVVDDLIALSAKPVLGGSALVVGPVTVDADQVSVLVEILRDPHRSLPVVVSTEGSATLELNFRDLADKIARRSVGVATVVCLDNDAVTSFRREMGDLGVWGGAIRTYAPAPVVEGEGWRHRYVQGSVVSSRHQAAVDRVVAAVAQMSAKRRVPEVFAPFTSVPRSSADSAFTEEAAEQERLFWEERLEHQVSETNEAERELSLKIGHLERIKAVLADHGLHDVFWSTQHSTEVDIPDDVQDTSEATLAAQSYLTDWLVLPDEAVREIDGIDSSPNAYSWGNKTWRGLRALAAFAEERASGYQGSFWDWCKVGGPMCWPANSKHLAMTESETVQNNRRFMAARRLPVARSVDESGSVVMLSHLKIAEGGGDLAPRVYFHDDTSGTTSKIHVGFVGPHYLVPNTKS